MSIQKRIQETVAITFKDESLLREAFTHASFSNEKSGQNRTNNERLEFLGDAVIEVVVSDYLFHNFLQWPEGQLTRFRAQLVCEQTLSTLAKECGFDRLVMLGKGEENSGGRQRNALLCDLFEAFVGALYLDQGMDVAKNFILSQIVPKIQVQQNQLFKDYKTLLQEKLQQAGSVSIKYMIVNEEGLAHDKVFESAVLLNGTEIGRGRGKNKKSAEQAAAQQAYERMGE